jgi:nucleoid-associated protein YgaU
MVGTIDLPGIGPTSKTVVAGSGVAVAGLTFYLYRRNQSAAAAPVDPNADLTAADPTGDIAAAGGIDGGGYFPNAYGGTSYTDNTGGTVAAISTNAQWTQQAVEYLTSTTGVGGGVASAALSRYITGQSIVKGSHEETIVHEAIAAVGLPPQAGTHGFPPSIHTVAGPAPKPTRRTVHHKTVHGDSLGSLAHYYYGNRTRWAAIRTANRGKFKSAVHENTALTPGMVLTIPDAVYHTGN